MSCYFLFYGRGLGKRDFPKHHKNIKLVLPPCPLFTSLEKPKIHQMFFRPLISLQPPLYQLNKFLYWNIQPSKHFDLFFHIFPHQYKIISQIYEIVWTITHWSLLITIYFADEWNSFREAVIFLSIPSYPWTPSRYVFSSCCPLFIHY